MNNKASFIESLIYSKAHDTWATSKEFDHLHRVLSEERTRKAKKTVREYDKNPPNSIGDASEIQAATSYNRQQRHSQNWGEYRSAGVKSPTPITEQKKLREMLEYLLKKEPSVGFWKNLSHWRSDFTFKQGAAIKRSYDERAKHDPNFTPIPDQKFNDGLTEEERNDPNWVPWK